jgi:hypothetical protein
MDEINHTPHGGPGHETTDINVWAVGKFGIYLTLVVLLSVALLFGLMRYFQSQEPQEVAQTVVPDKVFPEPRLERNEAIDLDKFRAREQQTLTTYGWVDQSKGVVRIPIDRAIDLVAQKGLPSRHPVTQASEPVSAAKPEAKQ